MMAMRAMMMAMMAMLMTMMKTTTMTMAMAMIYTDADDDGDGDDDATYRRRHVSYTSRLNVGGARPGGGGTAARRWRRAAARSTAAGVDMAARVRSACCPRSSQPILESGFARLPPFPTGLRKGPCILDVRTYRGHLEEVRPWIRGAHAGGNRKQCSARSSSSRRLASSRRSWRREGRERCVFGVVQTRARTPGARDLLARSRSLARSHGTPSLARRRDMRLSHATVARSSCDRGERGNGASNAPPRPPTSRRPPPSWPRRSHVRCFAPMLLSLPGTTPTMTMAPAMATAAVATAAMATATAATARPIAAASPPAASRSRRPCSTCSRGSASRIRECSLGRSASRCVTRTARRRGAATVVTTRLAEPQPLRVVMRRASNGAELSSSSDARPAWTAATSAAALSLRVCGFVCVCVYDFLRRHRPREVRARGATELVWHTDKPLFLPG